VTSLISLFPTSDIQLLIALDELTIQEAVDGEVTYVMAGRRERESYLSV